MKTPLSLAIILLATGAFAQDFAGGVQARHGNTAPGGGFSAGETNSRIDDYIHQDEQINVTPTDGVVRVLRTNQKNLVNQYVTEAFPVSRVTISELIFITRIIAGKEGGWAEVFFNREDGTNHVSVVAPPHQMPYFRDALALLDKPWLRLFDDGSVQTTYKARYRPADVIAAIADGWAPFGVTEVDLRANQAVHSDEEVWSEMWHQAANMVDIPVHQADLDVTVYEITVDSGLRLGLDYIAWKNGPGSSLFDLLLAGHDSDSHAHGASSIYDYVNPVNSAIGRQSISAASHLYRASANYLLTAAYVDFLATRGRARVLNSTRIRLTSGHTANVSAVTDVLTLSASPEAPADGLEPTTVTAPLLRLVLDANGRPVRDRDGRYSYESVVIDEPTYDIRLDRPAAGVQAGIDVEFSASIALESMELAVEMTQRSVNGMTPSGQPIIGEFTVASDVRLADGTPFVLTGLARSADVESTAKMPFLGSIPILGYLFGGENNSSAERLLVTVIVPRMHALPPNAFVRNDWQPGETSIADGGMPAWAEAIKEMATGTTDADLPKSLAGFDQYLLGKDTF